MIDANYTGEVRQIIYRCACCGKEEEPQLWKYDADSKNRGFPQVDVIDFLRCKECTINGAPLPGKSVKAERVR